MGFANVQGFAYANSNKKLNFQIFNFHISSFQKLICLRMSLPLHHSSPILQKQGICSHTHTKLYYWTFLWGIKVSKDPNKVVYGKTDLGEDPFRNLSRCVKYTRPPIIPCHSYVCMYVKMEFALKGRYFGSFCNFSEFRILEKVHIGNTDSFHCNWSALQDYQKL